MRLGYNGDASFQDDLGWISEIAGIAPGYFRFCVRYHTLADDSASLGAGRHWRYFALN